MSVLKNSFQHSGFRNLLGAFALGNLADGMSFAIGPILAAMITSDPKQVALVGTFRSLPWILSIFTGHFIDSYKRKSIIVWAGSVRVVCFLALVALAYVDMLSIFWICFFSFVCGVSETFYDNTIRTVTKDVVPDKDLTDANAVTTFFERLCNWFAGRALGGLIASSLGAFVGLIAVPVTYLISVLWSTKIAVKELENPAPKGSVIKSSMEGVKIISSRPTLMKVVSMSILANFCFAGVDASLILFVKEFLGKPEAVYGMIFSASGVGMTLTAFFVPYFLRRFGVFYAYLCGIGSVGPALLMVYFYPSVVTTWLCFFVVGCAFAVCAIVHNTYYQKSTDSAVLGRVYAGVRCFSWGATPLGQAGGGLAASLIGLQNVYLLFGIIVSVAVVILFTIDREELRLVFL